MSATPMESELILIAGALITVMIAGGDVREGIVCSVEGPPLYRRLDCDARALAYVFVRPKKRAVRVDVPGYWRAPDGACRLKSEGAASAATLFVRTRDDVEVARAYLVETIARTRAAIGEHR